MKILKQGLTEIYDYTCEEIIETTCPVCKAIFEYSQSDCKTERVEKQQLLAYNSSFCNPYRGSGLSPLPLPVKSYLYKYVACPCCLYKIIIGIGINNITEELK